MQRRPAPFHTNNEARVHHAGLVLCRKAGSGEGQPASDYPQPPVFGAVVPGAVAVVVFMGAAVVLPPAPFAAVWAPSLAVPVTGAAPVAGFTPAVAVEALASAGAEPFASATGATTFAPVAGAGATVGFGP